MLNREGIIIFLGTLRKPDILFPPEAGTDEPDKLQPWADRV
jgi:hypothetical protein